MQALIFSNFTIIPNLICLKQELPCFYEKIFKTVIHTIYFEFISYLKWLLNILVLF